MGYDAPVNNDDVTLGRTPPLEPLDAHQVAVWRTMSPARRLELAFQAYQFALDVLRVTEKKRHPDLSAESLAWRVTRRMQGDPSLGR
ncbi:MAG: hypothetical protein AB1512_29705 [Thermodesulfobacteriota bacterium]